ELRQPLDQFLLLRSQLFHLLARNSRLHQGRAALIISRARESLAHAAFKIPLLLGKLLGLSCQLFHLLASLLFAFSGERLARFTEPLGGAAGFRLALGRSLVLRGARILHVPRGFGQPLDGAIERRILPAR